MFRQVLCNEYFVAGFYYSGVIDIYILYEEPGTYAVVCQRASLLHELHHIVIEQQPCLIFGVCCTIKGTSSPEMAVIAMDSFKQSVGQDTALYIRLQIYPQTLSAVSGGALQWRGHSPNIRWPWPTATPPDWQHH